MSQNFTAEQERKLNKQFRNEHVKMMVDINTFFALLFVFLSVFAASFTMIALVNLYGFTLSLIASGCVGGVFLISSLTALNITYRYRQKLYVNDCKQELMNRD